MDFRIRIWAALFFAALFFTGTVSAQVRPDFNRKQTYDVQHYLIRTSFDRAKFEVIGDTTIILKPLAANLTTVEFDQVGLNFKNVVLDPAGTQLKFRAVPGKIVALRSIKHMAKRHGRGPTHIHRGKTDKRAFISSSR
jgi:hypothetical protein